MTIHTETIGGASLMLGDCIERMRDIADASVDLVLTDVPYSSGATREAGKTAYNKTMTKGSRGEGGRWFGSDCLSTRGFQELLRSCAVEWQRVLKPGGHLLAFIDWRMMDHLADSVDGGADHALFCTGRAGDALESADLRRVGLLVWDKTYFTMGTHFRHQHELILHFTKGKGQPPLRRNASNVLRHAPVRGGLHPTEKPVSLLQELIGVVCPAGGLVLDAFAGSFSTGHAALATGRRFIGIERDEEFFALGCHRLATLVEECAA